MTRDARRCAGAAVPVTGSIMIAAPASAATTVRVSFDQGDATEARNGSLSITDGAIRGIRVSAPPPCATPETKDERSVARPRESACDGGAFEKQA